MSQFKYGLRGKDIKKVAKKFADEEKARKEKKEAEKRAAAEQRVNALRSVLKCIAADMSRNEVLERDMPYITAADALDICNTEVAKHPTDAGLRHLKSHVYVDYIKDDMKTYTVHEMAKLQSELVSANPSSRVASVIEKGFIAASIFQEDYQQYAKLAAQIKDQDDFERVCIENGIVGDEMPVFRAQCMIAKLAQMNNEDDSENLEESDDDTSFEEDSPTDEISNEEGEVDTEAYIPSPNTGEQLKVTVESEGDGMEAAEGPEQNEEGLVDDDPVELLGDLGNVNQVAQEVAPMDDMGMDVMPVPQNIEDLPPVEDLVDGEEEGSSVMLEDPSSDSGETIEVVLNIGDGGEVLDESDESFDFEDDGAAPMEDEDEKQAFEDPNHTLRRKLRKLLRRSLGSGRRRRAGKHPCVMYYNANGERSELDRFRAYDMVDALEKVTKYALDSGLVGKVYANTKEAAIELESGNIVTIFLGETDYAKKIASLTYEDAYRYVRTAGVNIANAESRILDGKDLTAYGYKLAFNDNGEYEFSHKGTSIRTADVLNFRPLLKDFVMQAAVEYLKHAQDDQLMNEIDNEIDMFTNDGPEGESAGLDMVELDNGLIAEMEKNGPEIRVLTVRDASGSEIEVTPQIEEEAMSKYQMEDGSSEAKIAKLGGIDTFTFRCASCGEFATVPMPEEACNLDCSVCGTENTRGQIIASLSEVDDINFNYLFKTKHAERIASNLEDRGLFTDVVNGMLHIAEGSLNEDDVIKMVEEEMGELEKEADGPLGGDGQGAGPQYPNMMPGQDPNMPQTAVPPGAQQNLMQDVQYDVGNASPDQQRDDPGGVSNQEMVTGQAQTAPILPNTPNVSKSQTEGVLGDMTKNVDILAPAKAVYNKVMGNPQKKAYRVAYILNGDLYEKDVTASSQFAIRTYFANKYPKAFIKSAQELEELSPEGAMTPEMYFEEFKEDNEIIEEVDHDDLMSFLMEEASHIMYDVEPDVWWMEQELDEEAQEELQTALELYFEDSSNEDDASLDVDPLNEDMSFLDDRVAQEDVDTMPVPKSAPEAPSPQDVGEESTFNLEQPVDAEGAEEIKSAFMYYRHEGLGPAEAIKKFMTEYDDENFDQSEIIRICGTVYAGDPLTQSLDLQNLVPGGVGINEDDLTDAPAVEASLKQASMTEDSVLKAVLKVASKHEKPLGVILVAARDLTASKPQSFAKVDGKAYTMKSYHNMDMSLKSPKAFAGVTSKKVKGEGKFPKQDMSLKSDKNYPGAFKGKDSIGVSGDPASGGKENAMSTDVLKGDKTGKSNFKGVTSKNVTSDPLSGGKQNANKHHLRSLKDNSQNAFGGKDSKSVSRDTDMSQPKVDTGAKNFKHGK